MAGTPLIFDIRRGSLDDGPGIRTTVFLKGCPLSCAWCHNPESWKTGREIAYYPGLCIGCGECATACPEGAARMDLPGRIERDRCTACGACAEACPPGAVRMTGRAYSAPELLDHLLRDSVFYETSGGGVTFSGGEPLLHMDFLVPVMRGLRQRGVHIALQTSGMFDMDEFREKLLPYADRIYYDIKFMDDGLHGKYTGAGNGRILENFNSLLKGNIEIIPRTPLVPGITAEEDNIKAISRFLAGARCDRHELLPYNPGGMAKRSAIGNMSGNILPETMMSLEEETAWKRFAAHYRR